MNTKVYKVITKTIYANEDISSVYVKVFLSKKLAINYLKRQIEFAKKDLEDYELKDYYIEENETSYERYLEGYSSQDRVSIWMEEDCFYDEKELAEECKYKQEINLEM